MTSSPEPYDWDAVGKAWAEHQPQPLWRFHTDAIYSELVAQRLPEGMASLLKTDAFDEAVSAGVYPALALRSARVVAVDVASTVLAAARSRYSALHCARTDVRKLSFRNESFDAVVSLSTLDHFESHAEIEVSLAEITRVLRPGGTLLLTLDNLANPLIALRAILPFGLLRRLRIVPYKVGRTCGPRRTRRMVEEAGLNVTEIGAIVHCPRVVAVALARWFQGADRAAGRRRFLSGLNALERLRSWPTRFVTGHFVVVRATKPG